MSTIILMPPAAGTAPRKRGTSFAAVLRERAKTDEDSALAMMLVGDMASLRSAPNRKSEDSIKYVRTHLSSQISIAAALLVI